MSQLSPVSPVRRPMGQAPASPSLLQNPTFLIGFAAVALAALFYFKKNPRVRSNPTRKTSKFRKGERVLWRGSWGKDKPKEAVIKSFDEKNGKKLVFLDNGHWSYLSQLRKQRIKKGAKHRKAPKWHLQSLHLPKKVFTRKQAIAWMRRNKKWYKVPKLVRSSKNFWDMRQAPPKKFKTFRRKKLLGGVQATYAKNP